MKYTSTVTYTVVGDDGNTYERTTRIDSSRPLTRIGAQRKLRAAGRMSAVVSRIETMIYSRGF